MTEKYLTNQRFTDFNLDSAILRGIEESGFEYCTPIQAETLPHLLNGLDVAGQAKTGTGKTAAFLVALFQHLISNPAAASRTDTQPRALVLAPTRELAIQIDKDARLLGRHLDWRIRLIYGGTGYDSQRQELQAGVDVLIGTPGRIIDYFKQGIFSLDGLQVMVLDEADRMFDLGFIKDIRYLFRRMPDPAHRLSMLFSATLSLRVNELAYEHMNNPRVVKIESDKVTVDQVTQRVYFPANEDKLPLLLGLLQKAGDTRTLVFINTKHQSERVADALRASGLSAGVLSGDVPQKKRESLLERFKAGEVNVLVATDVAARGLHISDVALVVNYDLPQDAEDYVHRIGRTARAGAAGDAISFACETYAFSLPEIEGFIGHKIEPAAYNQDMLVQPAIDVSARSRSRGRDERRGGDRDRKRSGRGRSETGNVGQGPRRNGMPKTQPVAAASDTQAVSRPPETPVQQSPAAGDTVEQRPPQSPAVGDTAGQTPQQSSAVGDTAGQTPQQSSAVGDTAEQRPLSSPAAGDTAEQKPQQSPAAGDTAGQRPPRAAARRGERESARVSGKPAAEKQKEHAGQYSRESSPDETTSDEPQSTGPDSGVPRHSPRRRSHEVPAVG